MKDIFGESYNIKITLNGFDDKKDLLLKKRDKEMKEAYEEIQRKYYRPIYETEKKLDDTAKLLSDNLEEISRLSRFDKLSILGASREVLRKIEGEDFNKYEADAYHYLDDQHYNSLGEDVIIVAPVSLGDDFQLWNNTYTKSLGIYKENSDDIIIMNKTDNSYITDEYITFYDKNGERLVDTKKYDYIYGLINHLVNYRYNYKKGEMFTTEILEQAKDFYQHYAFNKYVEKEELKKEESPKLVKKPKNQQ